MLSPSSSSEGRGGLLERGLRRVLKDVRIGSLLVQSDNETAEPLLLHTMLPNCIKDRSQAEKSWVFLLDAQVCDELNWFGYDLSWGQIGTGASAFMAIRVLLDHGVPEGHIVFLTFLVAQQGGS